MMKASQKMIVKVLLGILAVLLLAALAGWQYFNYQLRAMDPNDTGQIEVRIPEQSTAHAVADLLQQNGLIRSQQIFLTYCSLNGYDTDLQAGRYDFSKSQSLPQLAQQIAEGRVKHASFTIPEGYTVHQIGQLLIDKGICSQQQWAEALQGQYDYPFIHANITDNEKRLEGYLYPDTYNIEDQTGARDIINMMLTRFAAVWEQEFKTQAEAKQLPVEKVVTVASLVEREARVAEERKRIAGVIYNRLQKRMPLQIDATVLYSLGVNKEMVTYQDLEVDSPYNTYKNPGLPPGPIASPGRAAIDAAVNPEVNNYYYYVARGDGSHQFSTTYLEHLEAVQKYGK